MKAVEFYDDFVAHQAKVGLNDCIFTLFQKALKDGLASNMNVLEIGCGIGSFTYLLSKKIRKGRIQALDLSPASIRFAKSQLTKPNVHFAAADVLQYHPGPSSFDKIFLFDVLEHIPRASHGALFAKIAEWMHEGSSLLINIPNPYCLEYDRIHHPESLQIIDEPVHLHDLANEIRSAALDIVYFETYSIWVEEDYNFIIVKKNTGFKEKYLSQRRTGLQKASYRLTRLLKKFVYRYPRIK